MSSQNKKPVQKAKSRQLALVEHNGPVSNVDEERAIDLDRVNPDHLRKVFSAAAPVEEPRHADTTTAADKVLDLITHPLVSGIICVAMVIKYIKS